MIKTRRFSDVKIGARFAFRYGPSGERGGWRKVDPRSYAKAAGPDDRKFTVGTTKLEVL